MCKKKVYRVLLEMKDLGSAGGTEKGHSPLRIWDFIFSMVKKIYFFPGTLQYPPSPPPGVTEIGENWLNWILPSLQRKFNGCSQSFCAISQLLIFCIRCVLKLTPSIHERYLCKRGNFRNSKWKFIQEWLIKWFETFFILQKMLIYICSSNPTRYNKWQMTQILKK